MIRSLQKEKSYFWIWLAAGFIAIQLLTSTIFLLSSPSGHTWLGANNQNTSDTSVYISLLRQVSDGSISTAQLYNAETGMRRLFPFWIFLGTFSRLRLSPLVLYELGRVIGGIFLAYALWFTASRMFPHVRDAKLATIFAAAGVGTGWVYAAWETITHSTPPQLILSLHSEFAIAPMLLGSGHLAVSTGVLLMSLILMWERVPTYSIRRSWPYLTCFAILFSIHPYLIFLYTIYGALAGIYHIGWRGMFNLRFISIHSLAVLPAFAIYIPLFLDPAFRTQHTVVNNLPLPPIPVLFISLFPFLVAFIWRYIKKIHLQQHEMWLISWMIAAMLAMFFPVPWKRKLIEGLGICFVFLSMPFWLHIRDTLLRSKIPILTSSILLLLVLFASGDSFALLRSAATWSHLQETKIYFSAPQERFAAWEYIRTNTSPYAVIASNDIQTMLWTPAYAGRHIWLGHKHETTDYEVKHSEWELFWHTTSTQHAQEIIQRAGVTHILTTHASAAAHVMYYLKWNKIFEQGETALFEKK